MTESEKQNQKLYDAIFGLAIGDALGVPYEFEKRGTFKCTGMIGHGSHDQPAGTWSDDTSMTLATLKSLKNHHGNVDVEDIRRNFKDWLNHAAFTANGEVFDIGHTTLKALIHDKPGSGETENGNGSLMRILPLAFTDCSEEEIMAVSALTHAHWIAKQACVIYVHVARRLLKGESILDIIPTLHYEKPFDRLCRMNQLKESEIHSSGYVVDTLEASLWLLCQYDHYHDVVLKAVNLGDDTDTTAAVAGGLAGIAYGIADADHWLSILRNKELILQCLW